MNQQEHAKAARLADELYGELQTILDLVAALWRADIVPPEIERIGHHAEQGLNELDNIMELCRLEGPARPLLTDTQTHDARAIGRVAAGSCLMRGLVERMDGKRLKYRDLVKDNGLDSGARSI